MRPTRRYDADGRPHLLRPSAGRADECRCDECGGRGYREDGSRCIPCNGAGVVALPTEDDEHDRRREQRCA